MTRPVLLSARLFSGAIIILVITVTLLWHFRLVIDDDYMLLPFLQKWYENPASLSDISSISPRGGHWLFFPLLLQIPLAGLSHWNQLYPIMASFILLFFGWLYMARILRRTAEQMSSPLFYGAALPLFTFVMWSLDQSGNFFWGGQMAVFWAVLGITATVFYLTEPALTWRNLSAALLFCSFGIYSNSMSFALLPVALCLIILHPGAPRKWLCVTLWVLYSAVVIRHYHTAGGGALQKIVIRSPFFYVDFVVHFLGAPITRFAHDLSLIVVAAGLALAGDGLYRYRCAMPEFLRRNLPYLACMAFATGGALMTAYGRSELGIGQATVSRYITFSNFFWLGVFGITLMALCEHGKNFRIITAILLCLVAMKTINSIQVTRKNIENSHYCDTAQALLLRAYPALPPDIAYNRIYLGTPEALQRDLKVLHQYRLNLFRQVP